ncbi:hypothetical protein Tco_1403540 [Tanacetum coccineum]
MEADALLAARLQEKEREQFSIDEQDRFLVETVTERKRKGTYGMGDEMIWTMGDVEMDRCGNIGKRDRYRVWENGERELREDINWLGMDEDAGWDGIGMRWD